jgi:uncharacterized membrane protein YcfT
VLAADLLLAPCQQCVFILAQAVNHGVTMMTAIHVSQRFSASPLRVDWVDYAKGICIILVVMMHSTLGVEKALGETGTLGQFIEWARPFRMPDFFLISGLFLARRINAPWRSYLDTKVLHFAYFYILWMSIQFLLKGYGIYRADGIAGVAHEYALGFIEPYGTLWFIYLLAVFFVVTKLLQRVPPLLMFAGAAVLEALPIETGWILIDEFASRFIYFYVGHVLAARVFGYAERVRRTPLLIVLPALAAWALVNGLAVFGGHSKLPVISLILGLAGACAVVAMGVLLSRTGRAAAICYLGANSIVVYLAFFLFMAGTRTVLIKAAPWLGVDAIAALTTFAGVVGPVGFYLAVRKTWADFLFVRPRWARVETWAKGWHSATHEPAPALQQTETR